MSQELAQFGIGMPKGKGDGHVLSQPHEASSARYP
jgi:hypothetical protein